MIALFSKLLIAHLVGDFILFRNERIKEKGRSLWGSRRLFIHAVIHFALAWIAIGDIAYWHLAVAIGLSHYLGDVIFRLTLSRRPQWSFVIDQLFHLVLMFAIAAMVYMETNMTSILPRFEVSWIHVAGMVSVTFPAAKFIEVFLSQWPPTRSAEKIKGLVNAGLWIGILERILIYIFVTTGHWEGIGFLLAAKSVFRFGDLTNSKDISLTEYIMVGTLLSFCLALVAGLITNYVTV
jgi:hypothetical protein